MSRKIAPSILAADFARLGAEVETVRPGCDLLHVDVMDGHFVPNLSLGPAVVESLKRVTDLHLDVHLMIDPFARAGADGLTVHVELGDPRPLLDRIRAHGIQVGLVFNPATPLEAVEPYLTEIDVLLFMSVNPGFGGQAFLPEVLDKLAAARALVDERGLEVELEIDGGITVETGPLAAAAGADILVAGSAVFRAPDQLGACHAIRAASWPA
jgi:ribulose-phosphate 3-epimerase